MSETRACPACDRSGDVSTRRCSVCGRTAQQYSVAPGQSGALTEHATAGSTAPTPSPQLTCPRNNAADTIGGDGRATVRPTPVRVSGTELAAAHARDVQVQHGVPPFSPSSTDTENRLGEEEGEVQGGANSAPKPALRVGGGFGGAGSAGLQLHPVSNTPHVIMASTFASVVIWQN